MLSFKIILKIAGYEAKVLFRSRLFRIFSIVSLLLLILINVVLFAQPYNQWIFRGVASSIPYLNILLLNVAQAVIGVFAASDFLKYDRRLDTTDVVYMRCLTNADYVLGKSLGVLAVFCVLNLLALTVALVFNVFFADIPVVPQAYLLYPLLISLPTLFFIFGVTFLLMSIFRSQALTSIVLMGYIAATLFFLSTRFHYLFDYMAINLPLLYSDFVGFGNLTEVLIHRGIYFLLGLGFIFVTVLLFRRLPQSRGANTLSLILAVISLAGAFTLGWKHLSNLEAGILQRERMRALNSEISNEKHVSIKQCKIDLDHKGKAISVTAALTFVNSTSEAISRYIFSLNPGLAVSAVSADGRPLSYSRNFHILSVEPESPLEPGRTGSLTIVYEGTIDERSCYLDIEEDVREQPNRLSLYSVDKRFGFVTEDYLLLTPETLWYPKAGLPSGAVYPQLAPKNFVRFNLEVRTRAGLRAVSQGKLSHEDDGKFIFSPEVPLPGVSLAVGNYEVLSVTARDSVGGDSLQCFLYLLEGHDYFSSYFPDLKETLPEFINELIAGYENNLKLSYPYQRFNLVETPVQFYAYPRLWTLAAETTQPEMILLPEKAVTLRSADFKLFATMIRRRGQRGRRGTTMTGEERQKGMVRQFAQSTLLGSSFQFQRLFRSIRRSRQGIGSRTIINVLLPGTVGNYSVFPLYYSHARDFSSDKWPIFNSAMEYYLMTRIETASNTFLRNLSGMSDEELANLALAERSLAEILADESDKELLLDVLKAKSSYLFALLQSEVEKSSFEEFINDYLESRKFEDISVDEFLGELETRLGLNLEQRFDSWLNGKQLPAFIITDLENTEILDQEQTRYQVRFKVSNPAPVDGIIKVDFRTEGGFRGMNFGMQPSAGENARIIQVKSGQNKEIGIVLDERPRMMFIDTQISQNLPSVIEEWFPEAELEEDAEPFEGENLLDKPPLLVEQNAVVVDNEDEGFNVHTPESESLLKRLFDFSDGEDEYIGMQPWNMPKRWKKTTYSGFFGKYRHSAHYIKAGSGENLVSWQAELPASGRYDVFSHATELRGAWRWARGRGRGRDGQEYPAQDFNFVIHHDDGADEVKLDANSANEGWNLLGTFYFSQGEARIELSDRTKGRVVYADAIKWRVHE